MHLYVNMLFQVLLQNYNHDKVY